MVLKALFIALLATAIDDEEPSSTPPTDPATTQPESAPEPEETKKPVVFAPPPADTSTLPPPSTPRTVPPNEDLRDGIVISGERLFPLVSVHDLEKGGAPTFYGSCGGPTNPCPEAAEPSDLIFGFQAGAVRSLFDLPGVAIDVAIKGFTIGSSARIGATGGKHIGGSYDDRVRTNSGVAIAPRVGYAAPVGKSFAIWPRVGTVLFVQDSPRYYDNEALHLPFITFDLAGVYFFARHAALTLTPSIQHPLSHGYSRRLGIDLGLLLAF